MSEKTGQGKCAAEEGGCLPGQAALARDKSRRLGPWMKPEEGKKAHRCCRSGGEPWALSSQEAQNDHGLECRGGAGVRNF